MLIETDASGPLFNKLMKNLVFHHCQGEEREILELCRI